MTFGPRRIARTAVSTAREPLEPEALRGGAGRAVVSRPGGSTSIAGRARRDADGHRNGTWDRVASARSARTPPEPALRRAAIRHRRQRPVSPRPAPNRRCRTSCQAASLRPGVRGNTRRPQEHVWTTVTWSLSGRVTLRHGRWPSAAQAASAEPLPSGMWDGSGNDRPSRPPISMTTVSLDPFASGRRPDPGLTGWACCIHGRSATLRFHDAFMTNP